MEQGNDARYIEVRGISRDVITAHSFVKPISLADCIDKSMFLGTQTVANGYWLDFIIDSREIIDDRAVSVKQSKWFNKHL